MSEDEKHWFWARLASLVTAYLGSLERNGIARLWIDDIVDPEYVEVSKSENRIIARTYSSEDGGKSFVNYKLSIKVPYRSLAEFEAGSPFRGPEDLVGRINVSKPKRRVTLDATQKRLQLSAYGGS
ncbi:MAG: hypothetical protein AAF358_21360 [Pseudomonadota bacterium]